LVCTSQRTTERTNHRNDYRLHAVVGGIVDAAIGWVPSASTLTPAHRRWLVSPPLPSPA